MEKIILDEKGYEEYLKDIDEIKEKIRKNSADISESQSDDAYGDGWHDNFAYEQAISKERSLMYELDTKMKGLKNIKIVKKKENSDYVDLNTIVLVEFNNEEREEYLITGSSSSDINSSIPEITLNSPLGKALYKKKKGDTFTYKVEENNIEGKIIELRKK